MVGGEGDHHHDNGDDDDDGMMINELALQIPFFFCSF